VDGPRADGPRGDGAVRDAAPDGRPADARPADALQGDDAPPGVESIRVRLVAANLTSGSGQTYDPGHGGRILAGLDADVVMIQELNIGDNSDAAVQTWVAATFGPDYQFYRESGAQLPNGVVSRYRIADSGTWVDPRVGNRGFAWAKIDLPGPKNLWAVSVHLLTSSSTERNLEAESLAAQVRSTVPDPDYVAIGGDFNTTDHTESCLRTLAPVAGIQMPYPADQQGNTGTNSNRSRPHDHVLADGDLTATQIPVVIGTSTFPGGLVVDTRVYMPLADLAPAMMNDSGAPSMQHMAIVKDFMSPVRSPTVAKVVEAVV
jgi:endonuclease/exonuclease/phosphatase family metal-dependent hydrolase